MDTERDAAASNTTSSNSSQDALPEEAPPKPPKVPFRPDELYYNMTGQKLLIIFNHTTYDKESMFYYKENLKERIGTEQDVASLDKTFTSLGFTVTLHNNKKLEELWNILTQLKQTDMSAVSCLCIAILTHGHKGGLLSAYDQPYDFNEVLRLFQGHPTLVGKPKLFFVQACRGSNVDDGNRIAVDGDGDGGRSLYTTIPSHADFLILRATIEDFYSYRDLRGSWMIQELCKAIDKYHQEMDILHIVTIAMKAVAYNYSTNSPQDTKIHLKRLMPEATFTLTKFVKF